jgi:hypothetical protein
MFYVLYWPVTLFRHATQTLLSGTVWSLILYSLPVAYYSIADRRAPVLVRAVPALVFFALPLGSYWPTHVMLAIHPDAAACGLAGLGIVLTAEFRGELSKWRIATGILLCVAAIACKQNAVLGLPIVLTIVFWRTGRKHLGFGLAVTTACAMFALLTFTVLYGNVSGVWFNNYVVPRKSGLEWSKSSAAVLSAYQSILIPLLLAASVAGNEIARKAHRRWRLHVLAFSATVMAAGLLVGFPAYLFPGAFGNAFAPAIYASTLLPMAWIRRMLLNCRSNEHLQIAAFTPVAVAVLIAVSSFSLAVRTPELKNTFHEARAEVVENYSRKHPGEMYFPFNPVAVYLAEGRFYHTDWGLENRGRAGFVATATEFANDIPKRARFIAYPVPPGSGPGYTLKTYYSDARKAEMPELPEFSVFAVK